MRFLRLLLPLSFVLLGCNRSPNLSAETETIKTLQQMFERGEEQRAFAEITRIDPSRRNRIVPALLAEHIIRASDSAAAFRTDDPPRAFRLIDRVFQFPFAPDLLSSVQSGPYANSTLSRHINEKTLTSALGLYLDTYLFYRSAFRQEMPFRARAETCAEILSAIAPTDSSLRRYRCRMRAEELVASHDLRALRQYALDSAHLLTACDTLTSRSPSYPLASSFANALALTLSFAPASDFQRDSICLVYNGRPLSAWGPTIFFLWYARIAPILTTLFADQGENWEKALADLSSAKVRDPGSLTGSFGSYSVIAIAWASDNLIPDPQTRLCNVSCHQIYQATVASALRTPALCYAHLRNGNILDREVKAYMAASQRDRFDGPQYLRTRFDYLTFAHNSDNRFAPLYIGFWLRRSVDGSLEMVWAFLSKILQMYDKEWYEATIVQETPAPVYGVQGLYPQSLLLEISRLDSLEGSRSSQMEKRRHFFHKRLRWSDFVSPGLLSQCSPLGPAFRRPTHAGRDTVVCTAYDKGILTEEGTTYGAYHLFGDFPTTAHGIRPGLTRERVLEILGGPAVEKPNFLEYQADGGPIRFYFTSGGLYRISHPCR